MTPDPAITGATGRLTIDLDALAANHARLAAHVAPAECAAVVKADAYGLGIAPTLRTLVAAGCRSFFVAHLAEAHEAKPLLPDDADLYVLNGLVAGTEALCASAGIIPVLNTIAQAVRWQALAQQSGRPLDAALQFDSGMSRLGVAPEEARSLAQDPDFRKWVRLRLVMSHLACADDSAAPANGAQADAFDAMAALFPGVPRSLANSGGIFLPARFRHDLVRPGIALYGGTPSDITAPSMRPVVRLEARIVQLRTISAGTGVGYGLTFRPDGPRRIATLGVGYADGWPRSLSNRGAAWRGGKRLPIVGRVSMDSMAIDVSALPEASIAEGDWVDLIGADQTIDPVAADAGTISYEILTSLGRRYARRYVGGFGAQGAE
ncbi:alanine racemase [Sphingomonas sp. LaA6.9]|uniref:alanine racemase n=1 Tax=Sphingomonas sp. LaA6.9 TaxID=2919914 RepID=UPI001F4FA926|nr:alanine racemase [Sphingomonas sp. LaA6.9]MCJ8157996.1 alanine racemase [Sphingomonas sp. LaA6.9]